jgi:hypothetical protein
MPYSCALAVCTTFCAHIAPALIPIFGPTFPSQCVLPEAPEHGRMIIEPSTVLSATAEAGTYRLQYGSISQKGSSRENCSHSPQRSTPPSLVRRLRLKRTFGGESPYGNSSDTDMDTNGSETSSGDGYLCSPATPPSAANLSQPQDWRPHTMISHSANSLINMSPPYKSANPILSAIPRSMGLTDVNMTGMGSWHAKRRVEEVNAADEEYDGEESSASVTDDKMSGDEKGSVGDRDVDDVCGSSGGAEKNAAWLLMKLSVKDGECGVEAGKEKEVLEGPRVKRRRATSM